MEGNKKGKEKETEYKKKENIGKNRKGNQRKHVSTIVEPTIHITKGQSVQIYHLYTSTR